MTPSEFKAWFDGFCEAIGEQPTPEQWAKVKAKVDVLAGTDKTRVVFHDWQFSPDPKKPMEARYALLDTTGLGGTWVGPGSPLD